MLLTKQEQKAIYKRLKKQGIIGIDGRHYWVGEKGITEPVTQEELDYINQLVESEEVKYEKERREI